MRIIKVFDGFLIINRIIIFLDDFINTADPLDVFKDISKIGEGFVFFKFKKSLK